MNYPCLVTPCLVSKTSKKTTSKNNASRDSRDAQAQTLHGVGGLAIEPGHKQAIQSVYQYHPSEKHQG